LKNTGTMDTVQNNDFNRQELTVQKYKTVYSNIYIVGYHWNNVNRPLPHKGGMRNIAVTVYRVYSYMKNSTRTRRRGLFSL
jgi:hypothetical protein